MCVGDYDNDGFDDLFITYWGQNLLYRNNGDGTFTDVTEKAGLLDATARCATGCTFLDYDRDGQLDLFVANYLRVRSGEARPRPARTELQLERRPGHLRPAGLPPGSCRSTATTATGLSRMSVRDPASPSVRGATP